MARPPATPQSPDPLPPGAARTAGSRRPIAPAKKILFAGMMLVLFWGGCEVLLLLWGVEPLFAVADPYAGFSRQTPLFVEHQQQGVPMLQTAPNKQKWFNLQQFPRHKPAGGLRIFALGGSTTFGRPYDDGTSFSGWLRAILDENDSAQHTEVINAGGISYASHRVLRVMEELLAYEPDLFLIYTGHNEFLEERTYRAQRHGSAVLRELDLLLRRTRTYSAAHRLLRGVDDRAEPHALTGSELPAEVSTRLDRGVGPDAFHRDDELEQQVLNDFRLNLEQMILLARQAGVRVILITPASNLEHSSPFKSEHDPLTKEQHDAWQQAFDLARTSIAGQDWDEAVNASQQAVQLSPRHAHTRFLHGQALMGRGEYADAETAFRAARDLDVCPLRATSRMIDLVHEVGAATDTDVVNFVAMVEAASPHGIPGQTLFLDHVHPTPDGHRQLAIAIAERLIAARLIQRGADWSEVMERVQTRIESTIDRQKQGEALRNLAKVLTWAGKSEDANRLALRAAELLEGDSETAYLAGNALLEQGKITESIERFESALRQTPGHVQAWNSLGTARLRLGELDQAASHFAHAIQLDPQFAPAYNNLGAIYLQQRRFADAMAQYQTALKLNPHYAKGHNNLAVALREHGDLDLAEQHAREAIGIDAEFAEAHYTLGTVRQKQGDLRGAEDALRQSLRLRPDYSPASLSLGGLLQQQGKWREAAQAYRKAMDGVAPSVEAARSLAWILATCPDDALRSGKIALQIAERCVPGETAATAEQLATLAAAYAELGDFRQAISRQQEAIKRATPSDRARQERRLNSYQQQRPWRLGASAE